MFCPLCNVFLNETDLVRRNIKYAMGNVVVEYDARCPSCTEEIGHVSWGQFTPHPDLKPSNTFPKFVQEEEPVEEESPLERKPLIPPPPELRTVLRQRKSAEAQTAAETAQTAEAHPDICPHCGQPWPQKP